MKRTLGSDADVSSASGGVVPVVLSGTDAAIESAVPRTGLTWCADGSADVNILVLSIPDCPNARRMLDLLQEATAGRNDVKIETRVVDTSQPMPAGFYGSPTVLIDGENVSGAPAISEPACAARLPSVAEVKDWIR